MSRKINYWCDSGANIHSCLKGTITLEEMGFTEDEWLALSDDQRDEFMREVALARLDWGYKLE